MENEAKITEEKSVPKFSEMVERMEKANTEAKEILARQEELIARTLLGGRTTENFQPSRVKEETPQEYAKRIMSGKV